MIHETTLDEYREQLRVDGIQLRPAGKAGEFSDDAIAIIEEHCVDVSLCNYADILCDQHGQCYAIMASASLTEDTNGDCFVVPVSEKDCHQAYKRITAKQQFNITQLK